MSSEDEEALRTDDERPENASEVAANHSIIPDAYQESLKHFDTMALINELTKRPLDRAQILTLMARAKKADGGDWMSANKISSAIGGTNADNMEFIAALRPKKETTTPVATTVQRPKRGW